MQDTKNSILNLSNISSEQMLSFLAEYGIINVGDIQNILFMKKKEKVSSIHTYEIFQGKGKDKRWFTYIVDESKESGRRKIAKQTETALYNYLYDLYFGKGKQQYENSSLADVYIEWLKYKDTLANRSNYIRRIDCDYKKYYVNEPLSKTILTKPLKNLTKIDIETWAYAIIKKYKLTKKAYYNMSIILRQVLEYMVDKEILKDNPYDRVKINTSDFVREQAGHKYLKTTLDSYTYSTTRKDKKLELLNQALA